MKREMATSGSEALVEELWFIGLLRVDTFLFVDLSLERVSMTRTSVPSWSIAKDDAGLEHGGVELLSQREIPGARSRLTMDF
jgi:hypothetical protein